MLTLLSELRREVAVFVTEVQFKEKIHNREKEGFAVGREIIFCREMVWEADAKNRILRLHPACVASRVGDRTVFSWLTEAVSVPSAKIKNMRLVHRDLA